MTEGEKNQVFVVMGVSGSGKTTVGLELAKKIEAPFFDGDDFHPPENVAKMASGIPLDDDDRYPWLVRLHDLIADHLARGETAVLASSALKKNYRDQLRVNDQVQFIFLDGDFDLIWSRMQARQDHYMKAEMLRSQFEALEPPTADNALIISVEDSVDNIVDTIMQSG